MAKFAIIQTGGKQYKVEKDSTVDVELLDKKDGSKVEFSEVLLISDGKETKIGNPFIKDAKVVGEAVETVKGPKIDGLKFKAKSRYRVRYGHRQKYTRVNIKNIK